MRLNGRRQSSNIDDRRGRRSGFSAKAGGLGIGGLIIVGIITWLMGGNPLDVINSGVSSSLGEHRQRRNIPRQPGKRNLPRFPDRYLPRPRMSGPRNSIRWG